MLGQAAFSFPRPSSQPHPARKDKHAMYTLAALTIAVLAFSLTTTAQSHYNATLSYGFVNNISNCHANNCFLQTNGLAGGGTGTFTQISSGYDLSVFAVDLNGAIWSLPVASSSKSLWTKTGMNNVNGTNYTAKWVAVRSATEIYAGFMSTCGQTPQIYRWDGTAWRSIQGCLDEASITSDDTLIGINYSNSTLYYTTDPATSTNSPTWVAVGSGWTHVGGLSASAAVGTRGTALYTIDLTNNTGTAWSGASPVQSLTTTYDSELFIVTTSKIVYQWDFKATSPSWTSLAGTVSSIFGSSLGSLFALNSNTPYHFLGVALSASASVNGYYDCNQFPNGCPHGAVHTATATTQFPHSYFTIHSHSASGSPSTNLDTTMFDVSSACDPLFGDPSSPECAVEQLSGGKVMCSIMGGLLVRYLLNRHSVWARSYYRTLAELRGMVAQASTVFTRYVVSTRSSGALTNQRGQPTALWTHRPARQDGG